MAGTEGMFIVDASSIVRAALTDGSAATRLLDILLDRGLIISSAAILDEVNEVLRRPKFRRRRSEAWMQEFALRIRTAARLVVPGIDVQENPLLDVLREKGGQARPSEVYDVIAQQTGLSEQARAATLKNGSPKFENQIAWARSYLVQTGYLDSPSHGVWRLTDKGKDAHLDGTDIDAIFLKVQEMKALARAGGETKGAITIDNEDDSIAPSPQTSPYSNHRAALIELIAKMTYAGFEEFCSELLTRVGVKDVKTTPYVKDGGIDGYGRLRINEFVSQPIAFQAKKYDGSGHKVSSEEIQRFRGAMGSNIAQGIFFTTTTFTDDAKKEATAPGRVEIELVDLERIIDICEKHEIGLSKQEILVPDPSFFELARFRKAS